MNSLTGRLPAVDPGGDGLASTRAQVAVAVAARALDAQREAGAAIVALLDPQVGQRLNARA